ncbi:hypothetical protein MLD38_003140 [Melastoma candidum]|nr:hypothetical protein MLD38_003140 [Melastoma candidum]
MIRSSVFPPPQAVVPPSYCYHRLSTSSQRTEPQKDTPVSHANQALHCGMATKIGTDVAINIDSNPFFMTRVGASKQESAEERIVVDANFVQAKVQYGGGIGVAAVAAAANATGHRKVGPVQYGLARMY